MDELTCGADCWELECREEEGGRKHYLDGKPVHERDCLEMRQRDGSWHPVRYEWNSHPHGLPMLVREDGRALVGGPSVILRWPQSSEKLFEG